MLLGTLFSQTSTLTTGVATMANGLNPLLNGSPFTDPAMQPLDFFLKPDLGAITIPELRQETTCFATSEDSDSLRVIESLGEEVLHQFRRDATVINDRLDAALRRSSNIAALLEESNTELKNFAQIIMLQGSGIAELMAQSRRIGEETFAAVRNEGQPAIKQIQEIMARLKSGAVTFAELPKLYTAITEQALIVGGVLSAILELEVVEAAPQLEAPEVVPEPVSVSVAETVAKPAELTTDDFEAVARRLYSGKYKDLSLDLVREFVIRVAQRPSVKDHARLIHQTTTTLISFLKTSTFQKALASIQEKVPTEKRAEAKQVFYAKFVEQMRLETAGETQLNPRNRYKLYGTWVEAAVQAVAAEVAKDEPAVEDPITDGSVVEESVSKERHKGRIDKALKRTLRAQQRRLLQSAIHKNYEGIKDQLKDIAKELDAATDNETLTEIQTRLDRMEADLKTIGSWSNGEERNSSKQHDGEFDWGAIPGVYVSHQVLKNSSFRRISRKIKSQVYAILSELPTYSTDPEWIKRNKVERLGTSSKNSVYVIKGINNDQYRIIFERGSKKNEYSVIFIGTHDAYDKKVSKGGRSIKERLGLKTKR